MTTIKLDASVRDRLNALAADQGLTAGSLVERLLEEYLWRQEVELAQRQMREAPPQVWAEYMAEFGSMDASLDDGLADW